MKKILKIVLAITLMLGVGRWCYDKRVSLTPDDKLVKMYVVNEHGYDWRDISIEIDDNETLDDREYIHYMVYEKGGEKLYCITNTEHIKRRCETYF